jgi:hypothetical protein
MAEGVTPEPNGKELEPVAGRELDSAHSKELAPYTPRVSHGHENKFRLSYALLAGAGLAAVAIAGILLAQGKPPTPPAWSTWKPTASGDAALGQIANHVGPAYHLSTGEQLVAVEGGPDKVAGLPVKIVLLRSPKDFALAEGKSAIFSLCGLGKFCSINKGKPSHERELLLQRESLELSLYTFRYVGDVNQVVVILPPRKGKKPSHAMFFTRGGVKSHLDAPLRATLSARPPSIKSLRNGPAKDFLERATGRLVYNYGVTEAPDASLLLELARFDLKSASGTP